MQCQATVTVAACASGGDGGNMNGFAWSETIGWISFNSGDSGTCTPATYGVSIDEDGYLEGYAWSENIGWIQFGGLSGFPSGSGTVSDDAKMVGNQCDADFIRGMRDFAFTHGLVIGITMQMTDNRFSEPSMNSTEWSMTRKANRFSFTTAMARSRARCGTCTSARRSC